LIVVLFLDSRIWREVDYSEKGTLQMARVFKPTYPKPIPADAEIINRDGTPHARFRRHKKVVTVPLTQDGQRILLEMKKWYVELRDADGVIRKVPGYTDKAATEQLAARLERRVAHQAEGLLDPFEEHRKRPLVDHLEDFRRELLARDNAPRYVSVAISRLTTLLTGCGFRFTSDLSASHAVEWLAKLRRNGGERVALDSNKEWYTAQEAGAILSIKPSSVGTAVRRHRLGAKGNGKARRFPRVTIETLQDRLCQGASVETSNQYLGHLKAFCRWLVKDRRMAENPLAHLEAGNVDVDRRHDRRELTADELRHLLVMTRASERAFRGLTGADRFVLYATACGTGFRASALASLTPQHFDLDNETPTVTLAARKNKSRVVKVQPLPADVAELLQDYLQDKPAGESIWGGTWARDGKGAEMLRIDLEAAGIPYVVDGPDGPLYADFHALRHTYLTLLGRGGVDLRTAQELAGHSTPQLTARYSHRRLNDLADAIERLPRFLPEETDSGMEALQPTGPGVKHVVQHVGLTNMPSHSAAPICTPDQPQAGIAASTQTHNEKPVSTNLHQPASLCTRVGEGTRTPDIQIHSLTL
jgi:integrase